jgi:hypothetical protein
MKALGRLLRFLFGLQALTGLIGLLAVPCIPFILRNRELDPDTSARMTRFIMVLLIAAIWNLVPAVAWWKLRTGKFDARWWAIAASVLCLPLPLPGILADVQQQAHCWIILATLAHIPHQFLELAIGITGLGVFLRPQAIQQSIAEPKLERVQGDGTSKFWEYVLMAFGPAVTIPALVFWPRWATSQGLESPGLPLGFAIVLLAIFMEIVGHELGHFIAGSLCGKKLRLFHVGPFRWSVRNGKWRFEFSPKQLFSGSVAMVHPTLENFRRRRAIGIAGGPLASLSLAVISLVTLLNANRVASRFWFLFATLATVSSISFLSNLIPQRTRLFYSDGAQLYQILSNGPWGKVHLALGMATTSALTAIRPRDWDINLIREASDFLKTGAQGMLLRLFASHYYLDSGDMAAAVTSSREAGSLFNPRAVMKVGDFYAEFIFVSALYARDLLAAEAWWLKLQALDKIDYDADYWKARSAFLRLSGDLPGAQDAWRVGNEKAQQLPSSGIYNFTRWQFAELRKALDEAKAEAEDVPESIPKTESAVEVT